MRRRSTGITTRLVLLLNQRMELLDLSMETKWNIPQIKTGTERIPLPLKQPMTELLDEMWQQQPLR